MHATATGRLRVVVIGGYGFFGRRLAHRLALQPGLEIVVAGRSLPQARLLAAELSGVAAQFSAGMLDVSAPGFGAALAKLSPDVVVHAAGPFQGQDYAVALACIQAGAHYIDLADGRAFVNGIGRLDAQARMAGVLVCSGASSVPALSSAATDQLAAGLARVDSIDIGISPGNRTERGLSTVHGVLSYCGQPIEAGGRPARIGWLETWRHAYPPPVGERLLSPCDVPDLDLLSARYPGLPSVRFGAGLELRWMHRGMNAMAWLAHRGPAGNWSRHAARLKAVSEWFIGSGTDAGAMHVGVRGLRADGKPVMRLWELCALHGDGPFVPTLAAAALVRKLDAARRGAATPVAAGARPCLGVLTLEEIMAEADGLATTTSSLEAPQPASLFAVAMGPAYQRLDPALRAFHDLDGQCVRHGTVHVEGPRHAMGRLLAAMAGTPRRDAVGAMRFVLDSQPRRQSWRREFPGATMCSVLGLRDGHLVETLGPARLSFDLLEQDGALDMRLRAMHVLGVPCPKWLRPRIVARERGHDGLLHFEIEASLPLVGRIVRYTGVLQPAHGGAKSA